MTCSVIIAHRNEGDLLPWTVANVWRTAPDCEVIEVEDEPAIGNSYRRHQGIMQARGDIVIVIDGHMDFPAGWAGILCDFVRREPCGIVCPELRGIEPDTLTISDRRQYGARFVEVDSTSDRREVYRLFMSAWHGKNPGEPTQVQTALGGCYAFRKDWYVDGLGAPWQWHRFWGKSEQMLCLTNYLCGGDSWCLPETWAGHLFKPTRTGKHPMWMLRQNTYYILFALLDKASRERVWREVGMPTNPAPGYGREHLDAMGAITSTESHLRRHQVRSYEEFISLS